MFKNHWLRRLFRRQVRERDLWEAAFLRSKAGPERCIDNRCNCASIGLRRESICTQPARFLEMAREVCFNNWRDCIGRLIRCISTHISICLYCPLAELSARVWAPFWFLRTEICFHRLTQVSMHFHLRRL